MKQNLLTQRLIGAVVLVSLAVIFLPVFLGGGGDVGGLILRTNIPPEPQFDFSLEAPTDGSALVAEVDAHTAVKIVETDVDLDGDKVAALQAQTPTAADSSKPPATAVAEASNHDSKPVKANQPHTRVIPAWVVQVASVSDKKRALALRDELRKQQFTTYVESVTMNAKVSYRVRVGPESSREAAKSTLQAIKERMNMSGIIVRH